MNLHRVVFVCFMVIVSGCLLPVRSTGAASPEADAKAFVQKFYDTYLPKAQAETSGPAWQYVVDHMSADFDADLVAGLKEDLAAQAKAPADDIVGLDFDPFLDAQDLPERYEVKSVSRKDAKYLADVYCVMSGKRSEKPCVIPELVQDNGKWRFVNFDYPEGGDLRAVLVALKAERDKTSN